MFGEFNLCCVAPAMNIKYFPNYGTFQTWYRIYFCGLQSIFHANIKTNTFRLWEHYNHEVTWNLK